MYENWPPELKMAIFYTYHTGGHIVHDVIMGKALGYPESNAKVKKWHQNIEIFCDNKNVQKYNSKLS